MLVGGQSDPMQSTQLLIDPELINQVYQAYVGMLASDKNAKVKDVLSQDPFLTLMHQGAFTE